MKKFGFTLAEVLITLVIIGIVAALTLPVLESNVNRTTAEKQTVKFYTQLQEAVKRYMAQEEIDTMSFNDDGEGNYDFDSDAFIRNYYNVDHKCDPWTDCFASDYVYPNKSKFGGVPEASYNHTYALSDGATISIGNSGHVTVDVNGKKGPNKFGYDMWVAQIDEDGNVIDINSNIKSKKASEVIDTCKTGGYDCFAYFKLNGFKIDY